MQEQSAKESLAGGDRRLLARSTQTKAYSSCSPLVLARKRATIGQDRLDVKTPARVMAVLADPCTPRLLLRRLL